MIACPFSVPGDQLLLTYTVHLHAATAVLARAGKATTVRF